MIAFKWIPLVLGLSKDATACSDRLCRQADRQLLLAALLLIPLLLAAACSSDNDDPVQLSVRAEIVEPGVPAQVEASDVRDGDDGWFEHSVRVTWRGDAPAGLDDARFVHRVEGDNDELITLGRGCGYSIDEQSNELLFPCTSDLRLITLDPAETHEYPVSIPSRIEMFRLGRGIFVVEEVIRWWQPPELGAQTTAEGQFTVRLTYQVQ